MSIIYRYPIQLQDRQIIKVPDDSWFLSVHAYKKDATDISSWWFVDDPDKPTRDVKIRIIGTGYHVPDEIQNLVPLGTVIVGQFVWHIFEEFDDDITPIIQTKVDE